MTDTATTYIRYEQISLKKEFLWVINIDNLPAETLISQKFELLPSCLFEVLLNFYDSTLIGMTISFESTDPNHPYIPNVQAEKLDLDFKCNLYDDKNNSVWSFSSEEQFLNYYTPINVKLLEKSYYNFNFYFKGFVNCYKIDCNENGQVELMENRQGTAIGYEKPHMPYWWSPVKLSKPFYRRGVE